MPSIPEEDTKKSNKDDLTDFSDYKPVSNFEVDFKNLCQLSKTKPWLIKKNTEVNTKKFPLIFPIPQSQHSDQRKFSNKFSKPDNSSKSSILIKDDDINDANSFFRRNMDPFSNKKGDKNNSINDKLDMIDNGNGNNYYSFQATPPEKIRPEGSRQEQRENSTRSGMHFNNNDNNVFNILNSNSILINDNNTGMFTNSSIYQNNSMYYNADENGNTYYRYTPTINMEVVKTPVITTSSTNTSAAGVAAEEEHEKVARIKVRGWKLNYNIMKALTISINSCSTITDITLWNCGITPELILELINIITPESQIKTLTLDQNPLYSSDELYSQLITRDSPIKYLSLRSNNITNKGAIALSESLKHNKNLALLNLWNNKIGKEGAEALAEGLKVNQSLVGISLSRNIIKDEGAMALAKVFSNILLPREEQLARKKNQIEQEKLKKEPEEDLGLRKGGKGKPPTSHQAKTPSSNKDIRQKDASQSDMKKKVTKVTKKDDKTKKTPEDKGGINIKDKKASQDDKNKKGDTKKGAVNSKLSSKKGKSDDLKDSSEDGDSSVLNTEHMVEINGQGYILGNRTINILNLSKNELTEKSLNYFYNSLMEQETTLLSIPDDLPGLIKLDLSDNNFLPNNPKLEQINQILNNRNPFIPHEPDALASNAELRENGYDFVKNNSDFGNINDN
ncbi:RNI-like protein [Piromyces finnis]|uniref:RNI-like protein n=1 Tax=Piromyces finnis TaxID=1754191 RepID=A0A1Y1V1X3_9FUNG|nr:RNI-like protein [Piromyces finnis]|eukprot:ORX45393.1 RNI-like protein [Piromyces finnis]